MRCVNAIGRPPRIMHGSQGRFGHFQSLAGPPRLGSVNVPGERMSIQLILILVTALAGALLPVQAVINGRLGANLGEPLWASLVSFSIGTLVLFAIVAMGGFAGGIQVPSFSSALRAPWWIWAGGFLGAIYVTVALTMAPRLGAGTLIAVVVTGQLIAALLLDHIGAFGLPRQPADVSRLIGAAFLIAGVVLIRGIR
jgi:transporter family-2 protein